MINKKLFFLSGLPRSGSTLLSSILAQNNKIHAEGNSGLCQLMWDLEYSCKNNCFEQLQANNRIPETINKIVSSLPALYYEKVNKPFVLDKCRSWTMPENVRMLREYFPYKSKIIVMIRKVEEIIASFINLLIKNNRSFDYNELCEKILHEDSEPIMRSINGIKYAKACKTDEFLFISYDNLVFNPVETIDKIYQFCEWDHFNHDLNNIENSFPENDEIYNLKGFHTVRSSLGKLNNYIELPIEFINRCSYLNKQIGI